MAEEIRVVAFDLGRVLIDIDFDAFPRALGIRRDTAGKELEEKIEALAVLYETGRVTTDAFLAGLEEAFRQRFDRKHLLRAWNAIIGTQNDDLAPIVESVHRRYRTAMISNTSESHFAEAEAKAPVLRFIDERFLSYSMGSMKPDLRIYRQVLKMLQVPADSVLFVDDLPVNVAAAKEVGMRGVTYTGVINLRKTLNTLNIL